ncbi:MAG: hypothetical protein Aureis2KO_06450 [Aureisphaera sp.]
MRTINNYTFPDANKHIFSNTDYHILEHIGFDYENSLHLVNEQDSLFALWEGKEGRVTLSNTDEDKTRLNVENFYEPFYVKEPGRYSLKNNIYELDISKGFAVRHNGEVILRLEIGDSLIDGNVSKNRAIYKLGLDSDGMESIEFNRKLSIGYPFSDLILQSNLPNLDRLLFLFQDSYLIRKAYSTNPRKPVSDNTLFFFPGKSFAEESGLTISNGISSIEINEANRAFDFTLAYNTQFYVGLGKKATEKLVILPPDSLQRKNNERTLKLDFPQKFKLKDDPKNLMFISSSLDEVIENTLDGGYYFPLFESASNKNHCLGSIRYDKGDSQRAMVFQINDQYNESVPTIDRSTDNSIIEVKADEQFVLSTKNKDQNVAWRLQVTNLRASNALTNFKLYGFILTYIFLILLVIKLVGHKKIHLVEICTYIVLFVFLMLRILLHWRISTFVPIEEISKHEYENTLRSDTWFVFTFLWMLAFFVIRIGIFYVKEMRMLIGLGNRIQALWRKVPFWGYVLVYGFICCSAIVISFVGSDALERVLNIFLPISLYFLVTFLNLSIKRPPISPFNIEPFNAFNTLLIMGWMFIADAGFGIIFFLFVCLREFLIALIGKTSKRSTLRAITFALLFLIFIFLGSNLISLAITYREVTYILVCLAGLLVIAGILWSIRNLDSLKISPPKIKLYSGAILGLIVLASIIGFAKGAPDFLKSFNYVKYRAQIHHTSIDELIQQEQFKSSEVSQILRAGQNQWFINAYLKKELFEPEGSTQGFFSLKPHFNKGSGYTTQTRDVVVTRYVIAEHNEFVVIGLILLIVALLFIYILEYRKTSSYNFIGLNAIILIFTIAFFVWLTATNRFIFFGQDFPFLSTTSKLTLYMPFLLFLIGILSKKRESDVKESSAEKRHKMRVVVATLGVLLIIAGLQKVRNNIIEDKLFNIKPTITEIKNRVILLNKHLKVYQNKLSDRDSEYYDEDFDRDRIVEFYGNLNGLDIFIDNFNGYLIQEAQEDRLNPNNISDKLFVNSIYKYFCEDLKNKRNPAEILHLIVKNEYLQLAINEQYYLIEPPAHQQNKWMGHLYAAQKELSFTLENTNNDSEFTIIENNKFVPDFDWMTENKNIRNYEVSVIPGNWLLNDEMALLLRKKSTNIKEEMGKFKMINNTGNYTSYEQAYNSFALRFTPNDFINVYDPRNRVSQYKLVKNNNDYLMRNLWLNGKQRFFYPLGEDFIWAYNYANAVKAKYSNKENTNDSVRVSIDYDLTKNLNEIIKKYTKRQRWNKQSFAVSVVDGNGRIRAMVDYTKNKRLNPNDIKGLLKFRKESYAVQSPSSGRDEKGNLNLFQVRIGPGSSVKPIMYAATTSQFNFDWNTLQLRGLSQEVSEEVLNEEGKLKTYGGKKITPWTLTGVDTYPSNNVDYLVQSSNTYHSLVMFLGSYNKSALQYNSSTILKPFDRDSMSYPVIRHRNRNYDQTFNPENWPRSREGDSDFFGNTNSILAKGLEANFDLKVSLPKERRRNNYVNFDPKVSKSIYTDNETEFKSFSYPERSSFIHDNREQKEGFGRALKQSTLGGSPIVITPLKMSEMGGRLISMNSDFKITLDDSKETKDYTPFSVDEESWGSRERYYKNFYRPQLLGGLEQVVSRGTLQSMSSLQRESPYFYYAKTGTINFETRQGRRQSDKLLLFVISKNRINNMRYEELKDNKFYVFYFACYECGNLPHDLLKEIIKEVETNSESFEKYFNETPTEITINP